MKTYFFLLSLIILLTISCKNDDEDINPNTTTETEEKTIEENTDNNSQNQNEINNTSTDTTQKDTSDIEVVQITCPINVDQYKFDTLGFEIINMGYMYSELNPSIPVKGWSIELREGNYDGIKVLGSDNQCNGRCNTQVVPDDGFDKECGLVGCWYSYLNYLTEDGETHTITEKDKLQNFFGDIDTKDEAIFWAYANDYKLNISGSSDPKENGIKVVDSGYELRTYRQQEGWCGGRRIRTAYQIHICPKGQITVLSEEVVVDRINYMCP